MQPIEVTIQFPVTWGVYQHADDYRPRAESTVTYELRAEVMFYGPYMEPTVCQLDRSVWEDALGPAYSGTEENPLWVGAEEMCIDLAAQRVMAKAHQERADQLEAARFERLQRAHRRAEGVASPETQPGGGGAERRG